MEIRIGRVAQLMRYPVKSMAGIAIQASYIGWNGLLGDRRFAFRRMNASGGFPWLTAGKLAQLIQYKPCSFDETGKEPLPTQVLTPEGRRLDVFSEELREEVASLFGDELEMMQLKQGIFDDSAISVITIATVSRICEDSEVALDARRFRPNIVLESDNPLPFVEDGWVGGKLVFGDGPAVQLTKRDVRCMMINLDPDTAEQNPKIMKSVVKLNDNNAGAYGTVIQAGPIQVGDTVKLIKPET